MEYTPYFLFCVILGLYLLGFGFYLWVFLRKLKTFEKRMNIRFSQMQENIVHVLVRLKKEGAI